MKYFQKNKKFNMLFRSLHFINIERSYKIMAKPKIYTMAFGDVYPHLVKKVEKKVEQKMR